MDFRSINEFNVLVNAVSGNFLPLTTENTGLDFTSAVYLIFVWLMEITYVVLTMYGLFSYLPTLDAIRAGGIVITVCSEVIFLIGCFIYQRNKLHDYIQKMNRSLVESKFLKQCIRDGAEPYTRRLKIYAFMNLSSWLVWEATPLAKVLQKDEFTHMDFRLVTYFPGSPFTANAFVLGTLFRCVAGTFIMLKKIAIDVYINHLITLLTAEYRCLELRMAAALREKDEISVTEDLKECVAHHCDTMKNGEMLINILSLIIGVIYFNCIFRFCCTAFMIITLPESLPNKFLNIFFGAGLLMQVYLLCACIQDLFEASTSITDEAFYESWYEHNRTVRIILQTIGMGNVMKCKLNAFRIFDLTVPTVATILKQAYSVCVLLTNM